jgi:hypothetical protein
MPPRISGHDLMAIFPTNPPPHNVSCDDLFKKQARQFLSAADPLVVARESNGSSFRRESMQGGMAAGYNGSRSIVDPDPRVRQQPHSQHQQGVVRHSPSNSDSRPQTANSARREGHGAAINQSEVS